MRIVRTSRADWIACGKRVVQLTYAGVKAKHTSQLAAGLSYYFILSLFPLLISFAAALALVPVPHLFDQILILMAKFIPADSMGLVRGVLRDVMVRHGGSVLSVGLLLTVWAASGGVAALIDAVNESYDLPEKRSFVHRRALAVGMMFAVGALAVVALALMVVGPGFGKWMAEKVGLGTVFVMAWPYLRWIVSIVCAVLSIELIYMWAPSQRRPFRSTLPGAVMALLVWLVLTSALGLYLRSFSHLNRTYGTLAAAVALLLWLYWTAFAILVGAQFNAEAMRTERAAKESYSAAERPAAA